LMQKKSTMANSSAEEVLGHLGVQIASVGLKEITAHCPFHTDAHPSFSMSIQSGLFICYQCSARGTLPMLVQMVDGGESGTIELLRKVRYEASRRPRQKSSEKEEKEPSPVDPFILFAKYETFGRPPEWALKDRKFSDDEAAEFGIKWDRGWVIPIWSPENLPDLWGWQFKRMDFVSNYPKAVKKSQTLFGYRELRGTSAVLVESPLDVVRLAAGGIEAVASYGAFVSNAQLALLVDRVSSVILALDNDREGKEQTVKVRRRLGRLMPTRMISMPEGVKDPGELSDRQVRRVFSHL
jgi:DNA primase